MININQWESDDIKKLLNLLVGRTYGPEPEKQLEKIQQTQYYQSQYIIKDLNLHSNDLAIDLGSGCGFIADYVSLAVKELYCVDISDSFLSYAKRVNVKNSNVHFYKIEPICLDSVPRATAIYSTAVFIHFNIYDIYLYLLACYQNLFSGGRMLFDFLNDQNFDIQDNRWLRHTEAYKKDKQSFFVNLQYHSDHLVKTIAQDIGFRVKWTRTSNDQTFMLLEKS